MPGSHPNNLARVAFKLEPTMKKNTPEYLKRLILEKTGLWLREQDDKNLLAAIAERMALHHLSSHDDYYRLLLTDDEASRKEFEHISICLTTGETYFFRDDGQFALLRDKILPELIEHRKAERSLRIWSAACATGEEAYSLAMLLDELLPQQAGWNLLIIGTDINTQAINKAQNGIYPQWSFRMAGTGLQQKYFRPHKDAWELSKRIRGMVKFCSGNLLMDKFPIQESDLHDMDLILCRNAFIYFEPTAVSRIAAKLADTLAKGGYLITGHGELHAHQVEGLRTRMFQESVAYQKSAEHSIADCGMRISELKPESAEGLFLNPHSALPIPQLNTPQSAVPHSEFRTPQSTIPQSLMVFAWQHANLGELDKAAQSCSEEIKISPLNAEPYYLLALIAQERGNLVEAKKLLKQAIYLDHTFIAAYLELGEIYKRENDAPRAQKMRDTARGLLKILPADTPVAALGASTAGEILFYLEKQKGVAS